MQMLLMENIQKHFWGVYANRDVTLAVEEGEIHALLGENGAGKTTLMNILYGIYKADGGRIVWRGEEVCFDSPKDAIDKKIGMVHQHFMLVPTLTVSQNITLGLKEKGYPFTKRKDVDQKIRRLSKQYGMPVDPEALVSSLSVGEQQRVEIMKLLYRDTKLLILDEPTAVLTQQEAESLFEVLRKLTRNGCSVILITHRIPEVMGIADRVTVLRDTKSIVSVSIQELTEKKLSEHMIGRELVPVSRPCKTGECGVKLLLENVSLKKKGLQKLDSISFCIKGGEILGIAGVEGNGQKELAEAILGISSPTQGRIVFCGQDTDALSVKERKSRGIAYISDDRHRDGLVMDMNLPDNMFLKFNTDKRYRRHGLLNEKKMKQQVEKEIAAYQIKTPSVGVPIRYLSGGNQQKLILARELADDPQLIVAFQPTRGLDIGAAEYIKEKLLAHRAEQAAVLLISADMEELLALSDRIAVIHKGRLMGIVENDASVDMAEMGLMMAGKELQKGGLAGG